MSDEIKKIMASNMTKIIENTVPEKREETTELLNSMIEEIRSMIEKIEMHVQNVVDEMKKQKQD